MSSSEPTALRSLLRADMVSTRRSQLQVSQWALVPALLIVALHVLGILFFGLLSVGLPMLSLLAMSLHRESVKESKPKETAAQHMEDARDRLNPLVDAGK